MEERKTSFLKDYRFWAFVVCAVMFTVLGVFNLLKISIPTTSKGAGSCAFIYVATALPFIILTVVAAFKLKKSKTLLIAGIAFAASYIIRILFADYESPDYIYFLSDWVREYRTLSINECFIQQVGNYPPLYNYFLIAFSRMNISDLYLIKTLSFYCEVVTAIFAVKIIALVKQDKFNFAYLGIFLLLPIFFTNSSQWAQCDTMYTMCAVIGIYYALRGKSIPCFIAIGVGLAAKMQILFIFPVGLILLLAKRPDGGRYIRWRFIWLVPVFFIIFSSLQVCFGGSVLKVFNIYLNQATVGNEGQALNGHCANALLPFINIAKGSAAYYILLVLFIGITAALDIFIVVHSLKSSGRVLDAEKIVFLCILLPLTSVFFMPKMLDRFFYIAEMFSAIYFLIKRDKNSFTAYVALETGTWLMYTRALDGIYGVFVVSPLFTAFSLILNFARFFIYFPCNKIQKAAEMIEK